MEIYTLYNQVVVYRTLPNKSTRKHQQRSKKHITKCQTSKTVFNLGKKPYISSEMKNI